MEPAPSEVVRFTAKVLEVEEKFIKSWLDGIGKDARFKDEPRGWFILLEHSHEYLYVGKDKPNIKVGDVATVRITFQTPPHHPQPRQVPSDEDREG